MMNRTMGALLAASMAFAAGAGWAQSTSNASGARVVAMVNPALVPGHRRSDEAAVDKDTHAASAHAASKQVASSYPTSGRFVLLGLGVVLIGVVARSRRGFRRSGTILLR